MKTRVQRKRSNLPGRKSPTTLVHFHFEDPRAESVCIAGTFNDWHPSATPMIPWSPGRWAKDLALAPGTYEYALIVNGDWKPDPACEERVDNPFGGLNSVVRVPPASEQRI
jgi:1,4-alpha-glucan branching enzyme